ncbi:MAG TPA: glycoside hydrolase family 3 C-terminal domain-containing protein [Pseudomonadales bacterium]
MTGIRAKHNEAANLVAQMTREEKAAFCSGRGFWHLEALPRLGVPRVMITDGPHGLRKQTSGGDQVGLHASEPATCFPTASALASSWDRELLESVGRALGRESAAAGVIVLLGPGINIKRHPLCGRNFEYYSEDPLLTGELAAAFIQGVQSQGVGTSLKHYAVNNQELGRMYVDAIVDERTLREIYLKGFQIAVRKAQPWTVMCAYNRVNGTYCAEHDWLLNRVLRDEWGFEGLVVSDWGATNDRVLGLTHGLDLEMPGVDGANDRRVLEALARGDLDETVLDRTVTRNVSVSLLGADLAGAPPVVDFDAHHALARRAAAESAVLLKNEGPLLPLSAGDRLAVIGAFARAPRYQGTGSSQVRPTRLECAFDAITSTLGEAPAYAAGYDPVRSEPDDALLEEARAVAAAADVVVLFAGLPGIYESEGFDRDHLNLPEQHDRLIEAVCSVNERVVVVLINGAPVLMPWLGRPAAVLEAYLGGQAGGAGIADVLFGAVNPSGRLAETFPASVSAVGSDPWFPGEGRQVCYREGVYVGYRQPDTRPLFPFGFGLSYTTFEYAGLELSAAEIDADEGLHVALTLRNAGDRAGAEVVQLYVSDPVCRVYRPERELRAFRKIRLEPGEVGKVRFALDRDAFAFFDVVAGRWVVEAGEFLIGVGASSRDIRLMQTVTVRSADPVRSPVVAGPQATPAGLAVDDATFAAMLGRPVPPPEPIRPFHLNSSVREISSTWLGSKVRDRVVAGFRAQMGGGTGDPVLDKMFDTMAAEMPLRALALFGGGRITRDQLEVLLALLNRRPLEALKRLLAAWRRPEKRAG